MRQQKFLTSLIEKLGTEDGSKAVTSDLEKVRQIITSPNNVVLHLAANLEDLPIHVKPDDPVTILSELLPSDVKAVSSKYVPHMTVSANVIFLVFSFFFFCHALSLINILLHL